LLSKGDKEEKQKKREREIFFYKKKKKKKKTAFFQKQTDRTELHYSLQKKISDIF
jgi:hypothetical protein